MQISHFRTNKHSPENQLSHNHLLTAGEKQQGQEKLFRRLIPAHHGTKKCFQSKKQTPKETPKNPNPTPPQSLFIPDSPQAPHQPHSILKTQRYSQDPHPHFSGAEHLSSTFELLPLPPSSCLLFILKLTEIAPKYLNLRLTEVPLTTLDKEVPPVPQHPKHEFHKGVAKLPKHPKITEGHPVMPPAPSNSNHPKTRGVTKPSPKLTEQPQNSPGPALQGHRNVPKPPSNPRLAERPPTLQSHKGSRHSPSRPHTALQSQNLPSPGHRGLTEPSAAPNPTKRNLNTPAPHRLTAVSPSPPYLAAVPGTSPRGAQLRRRTQPPAPTAALRRRLTISNPTEAPAHQ